MTTLSRSQHANGKIINISLWIAQVIVAGMFLMAGFMKTFTPIQELALTMPLAQELPVLTRFIGIVELLGAIGVILPYALKIAPKLTVWAAAGLTLTMVLALLYHVFRGEIAASAFPIILALLSGFITWGRQRG
jgi:hypothetical protein